jgi:hypothetical protein
MVRVQAPSKGRERQVKEGAGVQVALRANGSGKVAGPRPELRISDPQL